MPVSIPASDASKHEVAAACVRRSEVVAELASKVKVLSSFFAAATTPFWFLKGQCGIKSSRGSQYLLFRSPFRLELDRRSRMLPLLGGLVVRDN